MKKRCFSFLLAIVMLIASASVAAYAASGETYTVAFYSGTGEGSMDAVTVEAETEYTLPDCEFTHPNKERMFYRWSVDDILLSPGDTILVTEDTAVTAVWRYTKDMIFDNSVDNSTTSVLGYLILHDTASGDMRALTAFNEEVNSSFDNPFNNDVEVLIADAREAMQQKAEHYAGSGGYTVLKDEVSDPKILDTVDNLSYTYFDNAMDEAGDYFRYTLTDGELCHEWEYTVTLEVEYAAVPMSYLHVLASEGGTVDVYYEGMEYGAEQPYEIPEGTEVFLAAMSDPGYQFVGWYKGDVNVSSFEDMFTDELITAENPYVFTAEGYPYICAKFEYTGVERQGDQIQVWITDGGKASVQYEPTWTDDAYIKPKDGDNYVSIGEVVAFWQGDEITVRAQPDEGYAFKGWYHVNIEWGPGEGEKYEGDVISKDPAFTYKPGRTVVPGDAEPLRYICAVFEEKDETVIDRVEIGVGAPPAGGNTLQTVPDVTLISPEHCTIDTVEWLYGPDIYISGTPEITFEAGETYYIYVMLKADEGYTFARSDKTSQGIDEGFNLFEGCTVSGGSVVFAGSRTFNSSSLQGDYLRLKIAVTAEAQTGFFGVLISDVDGSTNTGGGYRLEYPGSPFGDELKTNATNNFVTDGSTVKITAVPAEGFRFVGWYTGNPDAPAGEKIFSGEALSTDAVYTFTAPISAAPPYVCAVFEKETASAVKLGDVDFDGKITSADARLALRRAVELENYAVGSPEFTACDVDHSGTVTANDARSILRAAVELEDPSQW